MKDFCKCLVDEIKRVHENNRPSPAVNPVPNSYNPSSGTAHYFTLSGAQLHQLPRYEVCTDDREILFSYSTNMFTNEKYAFM